jgi:hypothetical protein
MTEAPAGRSLAPLPPSFAATRESLRALACYVVAPFRKARTGRIGLRPTGDGFGTPASEDPPRLSVQGDHLVLDPGPSHPVSTLRAAATAVGVALSPDPGVGHDLPPFEPDIDLAVDAGASLRLGAWYRFGQEVLDGLGPAPAGGSVSEAQLWPEHFDLAVIVTAPGGGKTNVGFSPGDGFHADPYLYVGPHDTKALAGPYWNAPFGAYLGYQELAAAAEPHQAAVAFIGEGLALVSTGGGDGPGR